MEAEGTRGPGGSRETAANGLGFGLTFVEGRAVLGLEGKSLGPVGRVDRLEMELPNLRFPFDVSGGVARFANRRCRLRELSVSLSAADIAGLARAAHLSDFGIFDPHFSIDAGVLRVEARVRVGAREADLTARGTVAGVAPRRARLSFFEVRVHGFLPVPGPLLVAALFASIGAVPRVAGEPQPETGGFVALGSPLVWLESPTDLYCEAVELALLGLLPTHGWRLPDRTRVQTGIAGGDDGRLTLRFFERADDERAGEGSSAVSEALAEYDESRRRHPAGEAALARGDVSEAIDDYRRSGPVAAGDRFATARLLSLLSASARTLREAETMAAVALERWPAFVPALLVQAAVAAESGRHDEAAAGYERVADASEAPADRAAALVAAAAARLAAGDSAAALAQLERAVTISPGHRRASSALSERYAAEARWGDLLRLLIQRAVDEPDGPGKARLYAEAGFVCLDRFEDAARARDRFEQAIRVAPDEPSGWEGMGRLDGQGGRAALEHAFRLYGANEDRAGQTRIQGALAVLDEAAGDPEAALARLREAAALDDQAPEPLQLAGEIEARRQHFAEAGHLLDAAVSRARTAEQRAQIVRRLADVLGGPLGEPVSARVLLEQGLAQRPCDAGLLDELRLLLEREGAADEWEPFVRRALAEARRPDERRVALARLRDLARARGDTNELVGTLDGLVSSGGSEAVAALSELSDVALAADDVTLSVRVGATLAAFLDEPGEAAITGPVRAELAWRLARLCDRQGDQDATLARLRETLEGDAEGAVAVAAWRRFVEIAARRGDATATAQALVAWADDPRTGEAEQARAGHLVAAGEIFRERLGQLENAAALMERAVSLDPLNAAAFTALETMAAKMNDWQRVSEVLERRIEVARSAELKPLLKRLANVLSDSLGRPSQAADVYRRLLDVDPEDADALLFRARYLWSQGAKQDASGHYARLLELAEPENEGAAETGVRLPGPAERAEAHLRLGQWARVVGKLADANRHVDVALGSEPAGAPLAVLVDVLEAFGRADLLVEKLAAREQQSALPAERAEIARARAGVLERLGHSEEAVAIYRGLLAEQPEDLSLLDRLAEIFRREGRSAELAAVLERSWEALGRESASSSEDLREARESVGLELAALLQEHPGDAADAQERAEAILRAVVAQSPDSLQAIDALGALLQARGRVDEADALLVRRAELAGEPSALAQLLAERARRRLDEATPGGPRAAYELLCRAPLDELEPKALRLRAELAETLHEFADATVVLSALRRSLRGGDAATDVASLDEWQVRLALRPEVAREQAEAMIDEVLRDDGTHVAAAEALVTLANRSDDPRTRNHALASLLTRGLALSSESRAAIHTALAEEAERDGDLPRALEEFEKALALDVAPRERARQLVGHARILVQRREIEDALVDVAEALGLVPDHAPALALRAELAFRNQDWEEARKAYVSLSTAPGASEAISAELLAFRRAVLAETFGDDAEAEAAYLEVAHLDAQHSEAREALAQIALFRGDLPEAARRLEEVLRLVPPEALDKLRETRERLGEIYLELEDFAAARHYLELVLAEEPEREGALEALVAVYEHLSLDAEAAALCGRLARAYADPERRAQALYRQGEILRTRLGDQAAANDAYLRASDLDPTFVPTLLRLVPYYWGDGDFQNLADLGNELVENRGAEALAQGRVGLRVGLAAIMAGRGSALLKKTLHVPTLEAEAVAETLAELAERMPRRDPDALDPIFDVLFELVPAKFGRPLAQAMAQAAAAEPTSVGRLVVVGRLAERRGEAGVARSAYSILRMVAPDYPVGTRLAALGEGTIRKEAWEPGAVDHALARVPLRRVLRALARPLAGFPRLCSRSKLAGIGLAAPSLAALEGVRIKLGAPPFRAVLQTEVTDAVAVGTRPVTVAMGPRAAELPVAELTFVGARGLEDARSGLFIAAALPVEELLELLRAVSSFLSGSQTGSGDLDKTLIAWLSDDENGLLLPAAVRAELAGDLAEVLADAEGIAARMPEFLHGCRFSADRVGLLACGNPLSALRALTAFAGGGIDEPAFRELCAFQFSLEYRALVA